MAASADESETILSTVVYLFVEYEFCYTAAGRVITPESTKRHWWDILVSKNPRISAIAIFIVVVACVKSFAGERLAVHPQHVQLTSPEAAQQILVGVGDGIRSSDVTSVARYEAVPAGVFTINDRGLLRPLSDGKAELVVRYQDRQTRIAVEVRAFQQPRPVSFRREIIPLLTKAGCNSGGCHGKAEGQNGFRLSIFGFDPLADYQALVMESRGRRVSPASPDHSLLFLKGSARVPHGGGRKIEPGSYQDKRMLRWITEGAQFDATDDPMARISRIEVEPRAHILTAGQVQQLRVTAIDAAGKRRCVTSEAEYESNATAVAEVDQFGTVRASDIPGEAAILVRYLDHVAVSRITLPQRIDTFERPPVRNFVDRFVWNKLERLGIQPSELASDAMFLRRVYLDTIGSLPTIDESRRFLADTTDDKRARLIDRLLDRPEYADYQTMRWLDILRADQLKITPQGTVAMQRWLHRGFSENRSFDRIARDLLTVQGNTAAEGPASFYKILPKPDEAARSISQLLLGVRIECAQCHHHPSERWSQADYVALAGFFTGLKLKKLPDGGQAVLSVGGKDLPHPRTGEIVAAQALGAAPADFSGVADRRRVLADWLTARDNPFFAKAIANRIWAHYFGRGLIEPIDDIRATNPAVNEPLMRALAEHLRDLNFDLKAFTRTLLNSRVYQLSSETNTSNENDAQNFSHAAYKTLPAEVLLDAICQATGVAESFNGWPDGYRAIQIWDNRMPSYFFRIFGRPVRASVCECERSDQPSIAQALHLLNSPEIASKISHRHGRARGLARSDRRPNEIVDQVYLAALARFPSAEEKQLMLTAFASDETERRSATEDVLWALLNSKEFVFNH